MKKNILISLLLAIGLIFSQITPPFLGGMRFDFLLSFMFIAIIMTRDFNSTILTGFLAGLLSALVTTFPGGQLPNILEKIIVSVYIFILLKLYKYRINKLKLIFLSLSGTFLSGFLFLSFASILVGLPIGLKNLLTAVVLPASLINGIGTIFLYILVDKAMRISKFRMEDI